jgi:hypothetical protein
MTKPLVAEFSDADSLIKAAVHLKREGHQLLDTFTPFRLPELDGILVVKPSRIRLAMLVGGLAMAAFAYFLQWYSSVINYPLNVGGGGHLTAGRFFFLSLSRSACLPLR